MRFHATSVCLLLLGLGCASGPQRPGGEAVGPEELLAGAPLAVPPDAPALVAEGDVLALSPEMDSFLALHVDRAADDRSRLRQLARAIIGEGDFGLQYDDATHTAAETFRLRRGNCLSFSTMLVAMVLPCLP